MIVIMAFTALAQWLMNICNNKITYQVVNDIRKEAFRKIEILPLKYVDAHPQGEIVSQVISDVDQFADGLLMGFTQLFTGVITILGTLIFMISINSFHLLFIAVFAVPHESFIAYFIFVQITFIYVQNHSPALFCFLFFPTFATQSIT